MISPPIFILKFAVDLENKTADSSAKSRRASNHDRFRFLTCP